MRQKFSKTHQTGNRTVVVNHCGYGKAFCDLLNYTGTSSVCREQLKEDTCYHMPYLPLRFNKVAYNVI